MATSIWNLSDTNCSSKQYVKLFVLIKQGGGSTPIAELYRYVPLDGVGVFALLVWDESQFLIHGYVYHIWE